MIPVYEGTLWEKAVVLLALITLMDVAAARQVNAEPAAAQGKILIAYFTWADNTYVADPQTVDVDASTSASVLAPGNVARLAAWIQQRTGGDLFSIQVIEPYDSDYDGCLARAADEKAARARPALKRRVAALQNYDVVFFGYPNW